MSDIKIDRGLCHGMGRGRSECCCGLGVRCRSGGGLEIGIGRCRGIGLCLGFEGLGRLCRVWVFGGMFIGI